MRKPPLSSKSFSTWMDRVTALQGVLFPLLLLFLAVLCFGLLAPRLGFYWDDWAKLLAGRLWGLPAYFAYYAEDRPLSSWTHILFTPLLGGTPLAWQVFTLLLRWLTAWAMWWSLNLLWPRARWQNGLAAAIFLVYPVFTQQPAAVTFHQQWLQYLLFTFSLGAMILGARGPAPRRPLWTVVALLAVVLQFSVTEYFVPVELLRVVVLWFVVGEGEKYPAVETAATDPKSVAPPHLRGVEENSSFPRGAWERLTGRSASREAKARQGAGSLSFLRSAWERLTGRSASRTAHTHHGEDNRPLVGGSELLGSPRPAIAGHEPFPSQSPLSDHRLGGETPPLPEESADASSVAGSGGRGAPGEEVPTQSVGTREGSNPTKVGGRYAFWICCRGFNRLANLALAWAPYAALVLLYGVYRLFIFVPPAGADPYRAETLFAFLSDPLGTLQSTALAVVVDEIRILVTSWADLLQIQVADAAPFTLLSYGLGGLGGAALGLYLYLTHDRAADETGAGRWVGQAALLGLVGVLLGPVPAWITGRQVVFDFHSDRYAMPAMFGAGLLFAAGIEWLAHRKLQKALLAGVLVALAVGLHLRVSNDYRWIWTDQVRFYWQLHWRAPGLQAPTALLMEAEPFPNQGLFSTSAALNLLYPQPGGSQPGDGQTIENGGRGGEPPLAYWIYTLLPRFKDGAREGASFNTTFRTLHFEGQTPDSLVLHRDPRFSNCLWVLEPADTDHPYLPKVVRESLAVSNPARILPAATPGYPPADLFGPEPEHGWCYLYEKSALARQLGDWQQGAALYDQARAAGYSPGKSESKSPYEWLPMITALRELGRVEEAAEVTLLALDADANYREMLCRVWDGELEGLGCGE